MPLAPIEPISEIDRIALEAAQALPTPPSATRAMQCAAREMARFVLAHEQPDERVMRLAVLRCGSTTSQVSIESSTATFDARLDDAAVITAFRDRLRAAAGSSFARIVALGADQVGMALAREDGRATVVYIGAREPLPLEPRAPRVEGDSVVLRGRLATSASTVRAVATFGEHDFVPCQIAAGVALPDIAIRCPMHRDDRIAWVDVLTTETGRVLGHRVARVLLRRDEGTTLAPLAVDATLAAQPLEAAALDAALVARANVQRAALGRAPLALEVRQSEVAAAAVPLLFAAMLGGDAATADAITLGVIAGWDVGGGTIRDASVGLAMHVTPRSPGEWLALLMEEPTARQVLLEPEARGAAIGARWDAERTAFTGFVVSYTFFDSEDETRRLDRVRESLIAARRAHGRAAPTWVREDGLDLAAASIRRGEAQPGAALDRAMHVAAAHSRRPVRGQLLEALAPAAIPWPAELIEGGRIALSVTWHRVPGAAWGQYVVLALRFD